MVRRTYKKKESNLEFLKKEESKKIITDCDMGQLNNSPKKEILPELVKKVTVKKLEPVKIKKLEPVIEVKAVEKKITTDKRPCPSCKAEYCLKHVKSNDYICAKCRKGASFM